MSARVSVDLGLCQGHQLCLDEAPEVFEFDRAADHVVIAIAEIDGSEAGRLAAVRQAVKYCPAVALSLEEDR